MIWPLLANVMAKSVPFSGYGANKMRKALFSQGFTVGFVFLFYAIL